MAGFWAKFFSYFRRKKNNPIAQPKEENPPEPQVITETAPLQAPPAPPTPEEFTRVYHQNTQATSPLSQPNPLPAGVTPLSEVAQMTPLPAPQPSPPTRRPKAPPLALVDRDPNVRSRAFRAPGAPQHTIGQLLRAGSGRDLYRFCDELSYNQFFTRLQKKQVAGGWEQRPVILPDEEHKHFSPDLEEEELSAIWRLGFWGKMLVLRHPSTSYDFLRGLIQEEEEPLDPTTCLTLLLAPEFPEESYRLFLRTGYPCVDEALLQHPCVTSETIVGMYQSRAQSTLEKIAKHPKTPDFVLDSMLAEDQLEVLRFLVQNPNLSYQHLEKLAFHKRHLIRAASIENPTLPEDIREALLGDEHVYVRECLAKNARTTPEALSRLAKDRAVTVRTLVAQNINAPEHVLEDLSQDPMQEVRLQAAQHPKTPSPFLEILADDQETKIRRTVSQHPNLPMRTLQKLQQDSDGDVRCYATLNMKLQNSQPSKAR